MADTKLAPRKATDLLKQDHKKVLDLFEDYEDLEQGPADQKRRLFETIRYELTVHSQIEEEIFYPRIESIGDGESADLIRTAREEHKIVATLLDELSGLTAGDATFDAKMQVLRESVEHHAREEEKSVFKKFGKLSKQEQTVLAAELARRKTALTGEEE